MTITTAQRIQAVNEGLRAGYAHWPYLIGGMDHDGIDCSGLTRRAWLTGGLDLPHNAAEQALHFQAANQLLPANWTNLQKMLPGDVLFYQGDDGGSTPATVGHCALFCQVFEGMFIVAQATDTQLGSEVIRAAKYENPLFIGYVR